MLENRKYGFLIRFQAFGYEKLQQKKNKQIFVSNSLSYCLFVY
ncbi:hypothetical protein EV03_0879 [Prochlorococcus marinus str. PAC1]|uniref:Uncharacterized protein n=1 Tax=Prochlorococcus marinus str. PAC1 TaxID=59924 RepID=A0A0A2C5Y8_PROMR|nr:hypothetical protein EV03_0879 [Prochlorococcus marinus str. PAC1]